MSESYKVTKLHFKKQGNKKNRLWDFLFLFDARNAKKHFDTIVIS